MELKNCPFCGSAAAIHVDPYDGEAFVCCTNELSCNTEQPFVKTAELAAAAWNRRVEVPTYFVGPDGKVTAVRQRRVAAAAAVISGLAGKLDAAISQHYDPVASMEKQCWDEAVGHKEGQKRDAPYRCAVCGKPQAEEKGNLCDECLDKRCWPCAGCGVAIVDDQHELCANCVAGRRPLHEYVQEVAEHLAADGGSECVLDESLEADCQPKIVKTFCLSEKWITPILDAMEADCQPDATLEAK